MLGEVSYYETCEQFETGLLKLNQLLAFYPSWIPALTTKMRLAILIHDQDLAMDTYNR